MCVAEAVIQQVELRAKQAGFAHGVLNSEVVCSHVVTTLPHPLSFPCLEWTGAKCFPEPASRVNAFLVKDRFERQNPAAGLECGIDVAICYFG